MLIMQRARKTTACLMISALVAACASPSEDMSLTEGPAATDIVTPFDEALVCLNGQIDERLGFAVGNIPDATGREQYNTEGAGRFVTQAAGDIVQSALFKSGVTVLNRRDMGTMATEAQWGLRDPSRQRPAQFAITGSINSLDFIPGAGAFLNVGGVGPRYRQNRILVGMDLAMTNLADGRVVANIALRKQIVADELGLMATRFTGGNIVDADVGGGRREALHYAMRNMLQLATFELLTQLMPPERYADCHALIDENYGSISGLRTTGEQISDYEELQRQAAESRPEDEGDAEESDQTTPGEEEASVMGGAVNDESAPIERDP